MSLSPVNVKRTWQVRQGGMEYRMEVELGGYERVTAAMHCPGFCLDSRMMPAAAIEYELQDNIMRHIRGELFPRV
jgi:hypothetical protein